MDCRREGFARVRDARLARRDAGEWQARTCAPCGAERGVGPPRASAWGSGRSPVEKGPEQRRQAEHPGRRTVNLSLQQSTSQPPAPPTASPPNAAATGDSP